MQRNNVLYILFFAAFPIVLIVEFSRASVSVKLLLLCTIFIFFKIIIVLCGNIISVMFFIVYLQLDMYMLYGRIIDI